MIESSLINGMATRDATGARIRFRGLEAELMGTVPIISTPIELIGRVSRADDERWGSAWPCGTMPLWGEIGGMTFGRFVDWPGSAWSPTTNQSDQREKHADGYNRVR